ncbi:MAG TPA: polysaccharide deacetylase [Gaiellaceae bacterium]|nr:polysaccharide deacetylase [Gaiellaceae bacterium]
MLENPVPWPNGARCAVSFNFDMDTDAFLHPMYPDRAHKLQNLISWLRYDEVAVPRIVKLFDRYEIKQSFFVPAWCIEQYPRAVEPVVESGHELAHHGYLHENPMDQTREGELYWLRRAAEVIERFSGKRPVGWRGPWAGFTVHSAELLAQEGYLYDTTLMADSQPYVIRSGAGELVELPIDLTLDDWPHYAHAPDLAYFIPPKSPEQAMEVFRAEFDARWEFGGFMTTTWHPFVSGRLARLKAVAGLIEYMQDKGGVWFATMEEIARHVRACIDDCRWTPRTVDMPYYTEPIAELNEGPERPVDTGRTWTT